MRLAGAVPAPLTAHSSASAPRRATPRPDSRVAASSPHCATAPGGVVAAHPPAYTPRHAPAPLPARGGRPLGLRRERPSDGPERATGALAGGGGAPRGRSLRRRRPLPGGDAAPAQGLGHRPEDGAAPPPTSRRASRPRHLRRL